MYHIHVHSLLTCFQPSYLGVACVQMCGRVFYQQHGTPGVRLSDVKL